MTNEGNPKETCCTFSATRKVRQLKIGEDLIGISQIDEMINEVSGMGLESDVEIGEALLRRAKIHNYVPSTTSQDYRDALLEEYKRRRGKL